MTPRAADIDDLRVVIRDLDQEDERQRENPGTKYGRSRGTQERSKAIDYLRENERLLRGKKKTAEADQVRAAINRLAEPMKIRLESGAVVTVTIQRGDDDNHVARFTSAEGQQRVHSITEPFETPTINAIMESFAKKLDIDEGTLFVSSGNFWILWDYRSMRKEPIDGT